MYDLIVHVSLQKFAFEQFYQMCTFMCLEVPKLHLMKSYQQCFFQNVILLNVLKHNVPKYTSTNNY